MSTLQYVPQGEFGFRSTVVSDAGTQPRHLELTIHNMHEDAAPELVGAQEFIANQALVQYLLRFGINEYSARQPRDPELRDSARRSAKKQSRAARYLAEYVSLGSFMTRDGWCSSCFTETTHRIVDTQSAPRICLCAGCGEATTPCVAVGCRNMARRSHGSVQTFSYRAEHRHEIRSFAASQQRYANLDEIDDLRTFEKANLAGITRTVIVAGVFTAVAAPAAFFLAPVIGGALGASGLIGPALTGAAATSHGLAVLGGGSLAAGGLGMAGGTAVVAAAGAALGGTLGAVTSASYVQDDKSFLIEKLRDGVGVPLLLASGFLTQNDTGWAKWEDLIVSRYPDSPVYRVHWGAKELKALVLLAGGVAWRAAVGAGLRALGARAVRVAAKYVPFVSAFAIAAEIAANPWSLARSRAEKTAAILADLLSRMEFPSLILVGHSLGGRVMLRTAELLGTKSSAPSVETLHLLGAAVGAGGDWKLLSESVSGKVWNYHSRKDPVLKFLYTTVQGGNQAVGAIGFDTKFENIEDVDMSEEVASHSAYFSAAKLR